MPTVRTMIADDNREFRAALKSFLSSVPQLALVGEASCGDEAVELVERAAPDLLILDLMMPGCSGVDVLLQLQRQAHRPKVIMLTLHAADEYRAVTISHGADDYVCKSNLVSDLPPAIARLFPAA